MCTNSEITSEVIAEVSTRYLTSWEMEPFRGDMHFAFFYSALCPFGDFLDLLKNSCPDGTE